MKRLEYYKDHNLISRSGQMILLEGSTSRKKLLQVKANNNKRRTDFTFKAIKGTLWFGDLGPKDIAYVNGDRVNFRRGEVDLCMTSIGLGRR